MGAEMKRGDTDNAGPDFDGDFIGGCCMQLLESTAVAFAQQEFNRFEGFGMDWGQDVG